MKPFTIFTVLASLYLMLGGAAVNSFRYQIISAGDVVYRMDRLTGNVDMIYRNKMRPVEEVIPSLSSPIPSPSSEPVR